MLENLGIYDLRNYARAVGVKSPTTKTRMQILAEIKHVENGFSLPQKSIRGRPPKLLISNPNDFVKNENLRQSFEILSYKYNALVKILQSANNIIDTNE